MDFGIVVTLGGGSRYDTPHVGDHRPDGHKSCPFPAWRRCRPQPDSHPKNDRWNFCLCDATLWGRETHSVVAAIRPHKEPPISVEPVKLFLIVDNRFGTPIHVFLEFDPTAEPGFPGFGVRAVTLEPPEGSPGLGVPAGFAIGRNPHQLDRFRVFRSNQAVAGAGFILIEPRYVGPNWSGYVVAFRPGGEKPMKRHGSEHHVSNKR